MAALPVGTPTSDQGNSATASVANTVPSGTDVAYICVFANAETAISSMANFGGVAPVLVGTFASALHVYRVVNPASGAQTAQANLAGSVFWSIHVICVDGVDADPDDAIVTATTIETADVTTTVTSAANDLVLAFCLMVYPDIAATSGATLSTEEESIDGSVVSTAVVYEAGAASVVLGASSTDLSFGDNRILAFNVRATSVAGPTITNVDTDDTITSTQTNWTITGTSFSTAVVTITQGSTTVTQSIDSQNATTIQCDTVFDSGSPDLKYGSATLTVTNADTGFDSIAITIAAPSGRSYVNIGTPDPVAANRITAVADIASGDQLEVSNVVGGTIGDVSVYPDGTFDCADTVTSFDVRCWATSDSTWGAAGTQSVSGEGGSPPVFSGTIPTVSGTQASSIGTVNLAVYFSGATSYSLNQALPTGLSFNTSTAEITGTPTIAGTFGGFIVTGTNGDGSDDSNTFTVSIASNQSFTSNTRRPRDRRRRGRLLYLWGRG